MTAALPYATPPEAQSLPFKDRRLSVKTTGVILILLGASSGCMGAVTPLALLAPTAPGEPGPDWRELVFGFCMYAGAAALLVSAGVGALRLRRWCRPVLLVTAWTWVLTGVSTFAYWLVDMPSMRELIAASTPPNSPQPPPAVVYAISVGAGVFMCLFMVVLPLVLLGMFLRRGVRQTLDYFDPQSRWTDACPTPVLALAGWMAVLSLAAALYALYAVFPLYGYLVAGWPAVVALLALAAAFAVTAAGVYRLRPWAWWASGALVLLWAGSLVWTFSRVSWDEFLRRAGYSEARIEATIKFSGGLSIGSVVTIAALGVGLVAYLAYVRRYFTPAAPLSPEESAQIPAAPAR